MIFNFISKFRREYLHIPEMAAYPYLLFHFSLLGIFFVPITLQSIVVGIALYFIRGFAINAGYHRYFSHKAFKTSRVFQFILAVLATSSMQQGVLWWANAHRHHHKTSDTPLDKHSPKIQGFFYAHIGWIFNQANYSSTYENVPDLEKFPELVWLDKYHYIPALVLAISLFLWLGWSGFIISFCWSTFILHQVTFLVNSGLHQWGRQRYQTMDHSRNNWWLTPIVLGENWHNNHHHYASSARQGFFWWEIDMTYYILKILAFFHIIWDLKLPSELILKSKLLNSDPTISTDND